jgi:mRNA-degrading endonuclease YafQ of YafQ-DinJ toxin-antitoxin module
MLRLKETSQFRKDVKRAMKREKDLDLLQNIISTLLEHKPLTADNISRLYSN